jgi:molecular chaperone DnaK
LGTKKEHKITIQQSSGLSEAEIEKMRKDAELHAGEDKKKRELAEARNQAESMCFQMEKLMKEHADKLKDADKAPLEAAITKAREMAKGSDVDAIKNAITELEHASHAMSKVLYESGQAAGAAGPQPGPGATGGEAPKQGGDDDAIDAEFEVKK